MSAADLQPVEVAVSVPDTAATYGEMLRIPVQVRNVAGSNIVSAELFLSYDSSLLTLNGVQGMVTGSEGWTLETNVVDGVGDEKTLKIAAATDDDAMTADGTLIYVDFSVADIRHPASSPLTLPHILFNDGTPDYTKTDGSVTIVGTDGVITSLPSEILPRWSIGVSVYDLDEDRNYWDAGCFRLECGQRRPDRDTDGDGDRQ